MEKKLYQSLPFKVFLALDGQPLTLSGYSADALLSDETKGKVTVTLTDMSGDIVNDADGVPIDHLTMFANGSTFSQAVKTIAPGMATAGQYIATFWYHKKSGSTLVSRDIGTIVITITEDIQASAPS